MHSKMDTRVLWRKTFFFCTSSAVLLHSGGGTIVVEMCNPVLNGKEKKVVPLDILWLLFCSFELWEDLQRNILDDNEKEGPLLRISLKKILFLCFAVWEFSHWKKLMKIVSLMMTIAAFVFLKIFSQKQKSFFLTKIMGLLSALSIIFLLVVVCIMHVFLWLNVKRKRKSGTVLENEIWSSPLQKRAILDCKTMYTWRNYAFCLNSILLNNRLALL